jgi:SecD-like export protein
VPATQLAPTAERLRSLMGRQISSPQVGDFIDSLTVTPGLGEYSTVVFVNVPELGFDLSFKQPGGRLQAVHLYGSGAGVRFGRYTGALPAGLAFGQKRIDVERRLGRPASFSGWIESGISAEYPNLKLLVQYDPGPVRNPRARLTVVTLIETPAFPGATTRPFGEPPPQLAIRAVLDEHDPAPADRLADPNDPAGIVTLRVSRDAIVDQDAVTNARGVPDENDVDGWKIAIDLTPQGGRRLSQATKHLVGRRVAIVLGSHVLMAPVVRDPIGEHVMIDLGAEGKKQFPNELLRQMSIAMMSLPADNTPATRK